MSYLSWGKPRIFFAKLDATGEKGDWKEMHTPVEGTTELQTTKGDKQEAKIEGGENEDVRYSKSTYALVFNIRAAKGRKKPIAASDGLVSGNYAVCLQPEDADNDGFMIDKAAVSVEDAFTAADGGVWAYAFDALKPADNSDQVKWGKVAVTADADGKITAVTFTETEEGESETEEG